MNFRLFNNRKKSKPFFFIIIFLLFLLAVFIKETRLVDKMSSSSAIFFRKAKDSFLIFFLPKEKMFYEIKDLRAQLKTKNEEGKLLSFFRKENSDMRNRLLGIAEERRLFSVLAAPPNSPYDSLILLGETAGVRAGDKVYASFDFVLGEVAEVEEGILRVRIYSSFGEKSQVLLENGLSAEAKGLGGGILEVFLPRETEIEKGEAVRTVGSFSGIVGFVEEISSDPKKPLKKVIISLAKNIFSLDRVEVDLNSGR